MSFLSKQLSEFWDTSYTSSSPKTIARSSINNMKGGHKRLIDYARSKTLADGKKFGIVCYFIYKDKDPVIDDGSRGIFILLDMVKLSRLKASMDDILEKTQLPISIFRIVPMREWWDINVSEDPYIKKIGSNTVNFMSLPEIPLIPPDIGLISRVEESFDHLRKQESDRLEKMIKEGEERDIANQAIYMEKVSSDIEDDHRLISPISTKLKEFRSTLDTYSNIINKKLDKEKSEPIKTHYNTLSQLMVQMDSFLKSCDTIKCLVKDTPLVKK